MTLSSTPARRVLAGTVAVGIGIGALAGCSSDSAGDVVTITLSGPNQFTNDTNTFGEAWEQVVAAFEEDNPGIKVETNVLPISSWGQTSSAQLTAGTAPELIFAQTAHTPDQISPLTEELAEPNPFSGSDRPWIEDFKPEFFGGENRVGANANGDYENIPFNLVAIGLYFNQDLLDEVGVDVEDLGTFSGFIDACGALRDAGYSGVAMDSSPLYPGWTLTTLGSMLLEDEFTAVNQFDADGNPGTSDPLTEKSIVHALLTDEVDMQGSEAFRQTFEILKEFTDECATENWSGIAPQGSFSGGTEFVSGKAGFAWGTNFASSGLADSSFTWSTLPFPTVEKSDASEANGEDARFGTRNGGTAYMIPAYIDGPERDAAVKFLQYMSSPKVKDWLDATNSISALVEVEDPDTVAALTSGAWAELPLSGRDGGFFGVPSAMTGQNQYTGYLIGSVDLDTALGTIQENARGYAAEVAANSDWTDEWAR